MFALIKANLLACILGLAAAIFLVISVVQSIEMNGFLWWDGLRDKLEDCARDRNELRAITTKKNEQKVETGENIKKAGSNREKAEGVAKKIEQAPIAPGECKTPKIILEADL